MKETTQFESELYLNLRRYIQQAKKTGTVGMSVDNLFQCVKTPSPTLKGAPVGTNARWQYKQIFQKVCETFFADFVIQ